MAFLSKSLGVAFTGDPASHSGPATGDSPLSTAKRVPSSFVLRPSSFRNGSGFSLVEVVLAVGVVAFAFVAIMGLIPAGMQQFRQAIDTQVGSQIAQRLIEDAEQTDFNTLIDYSNTQSLLPPTNFFRAPTYALSQSANSNPGACLRYFDEEGNEIVPAARAGNPPNLNANPTNAELNNIVYYVNTRVEVGTILPQGSQSMTTTPNLATVTIQVAFNPGHIALPTNTYCLFDTTKFSGVPIRNYSAQVGRNF